jgi:DNA-binding response OmpR family regulator
MPRILVIDDQADVRAMICMVLRINHFEVVEAATAAAGLREFEAAGFDVAIVDLPVVAISGMTALDFVNQAPELGRVVCLQKPFRPNELLRAVRTAQGASPRSAAAAASQKRGVPRDR